MTESKDKELSLDELKHASGGLKGGGGGGGRRSGVTGFSELSDISRNFTDIKDKENKEPLWPECKDKPPQ